MSKVILFPDRHRARAEPAALVEYAPPVRPRARRSLLGILGSALLTVLRFMAFIAATLATMLFAMFSVFMKPLLIASIIALVFFPKSGITWLIVLGFIGALVLPALGMKVMSLLAPPASARTSRLEFETVKRPDRARLSVWARWLRRTAAPRLRRVARTLRPARRLSIVRRDATK